MSMEMQLVMYAVLVAVLGIVGYYVGRMYAYPMSGAGVGILVGLIISFIVYKYYGEMGGNGITEGYHRMMY